MPLEGSALLALAVLGMIAAVALKLRKRRRDASLNKVEMDESKSTKSSSEQPSLTEEFPANNPWQERLKRGISHASTLKRDSHEKPFKSSYYYAHNNPQSKGGYKDGLRMEDYTMNQPRLLSRNGQQIEYTTTKQEESQQPSIEPPRKLLSKPTRFISRYLWDDQGKSNGIAYIRIEQLPDIGTSLTPWTEWMKQQQSAPRMILI